MENNSLEHRHVLQLAFGLPLMTTVIVMGSMFIGHLITTQSDRPARIDVNLPQAAAPKVDVNVPALAPPTIQVSAAAPKIDVHVPAQPAPTVTVNTPQAAPPNITINPAAPTVTIIDRTEHDKKSAGFEKPVGKSVNAASEVAKAVAVPAAPSTNGSAEPAQPATSKPASSLEMSKAAPAIPETALMKSLESSPAVASMDKLPANLSTARVAQQATPAVEALPTIDTLYACANHYVETYCRQQGLDPAVEAAKWAKNWQAAVEQSISDNIDSGEQSYINRVVIAKRDCFNLDKASPDRIVEGCRIMLRYRDAQLAWLQAMKDAMTAENLKKSIAFLNAGPK